MPALPEQARMPALPEQARMPALPGRNFGAEDSGKNDTEQGKACLTASSI